MTDFTQKDLQKMAREALAESLFWADKAKKPQSRATFEQVAAEAAVSQAYSQLAMAATAESAEERKREYFAAKEADRKKEWLAREKDKLAILTEIRDSMVDSAKDI